LSDRRLNRELGFLHEDYLGIWYAPNVTARNTPFVSFPAP